MKYSIILFILLIGLKSYSQDSTIVTNVQFKASTIRTLESVAFSIKHPGSFEAYLKWYNNFKTNNPSQNSNVTVDTIPVLMLTEIYSVILFDVRYQDIIEDFDSSLTSKRNANSYLDRLMTAYETNLTAMKQELLLNNRFKLIN